MSRPQIAPGISLSWNGPRPKTCQWIDGDPSWDDSCKCGQPTMAGSSYCEPHHKRSWVRFSLAPKELRKPIAQWVVKFGVAMRV